MSLRFHWMLPKGGEVKLNGRQTPLEAARYRIESMSTASPAPNRICKVGHTLRSTLKQQGLTRCSFRSAVTSPIRFW
jgi:hypothetical protein